MTEQSSGATVQLRHDKTVAFLGIDIAPLSLPQALDAVGNMAKNEKFSYVVTPNVDHFVNLYPNISETRSAAFQAAYEAASLTLCDSRIVRALARFAGIDLTVVPGSDLTASLFQDRLGQGDRVAIIGGDNRLLNDLSRLFPAPKYSQHIPPMGILNNPRAMADIVDFVENTKAHYVLFAIGAPQSEITAHQCRQSGRCSGVGLCIGASLEFITSVKKRAPVWMQKAGLEWSFRLFSEPSRLWRRYLVEGPRIFKIFLEHNKSGKR
ncbi:WecB/TagA/CpsF family glycosyltransferase [Parasphingorhabdus cellanae]|uniref:WecB/TagA/CpsF family glycosyltransferase n=1 Tax=Parasphingorhabdus cellanae TaxID=2806553 RepID=A0ABX7T7Y4_9SPHN|nr:WecB/TagA/CpsF family glycosyltransferase [Parasphingorhabdus cellanae]QTD56247.1 WecB/TagA/CpsF family glycosyltransferase [Parasphingorhabdus cellanae]